MASRSLPSRPASSPPTLNGNRGYLTVAQRAAVVVKAAIDDATRSGAFLPSMINLG